MTVNPKNRENRENALRSNGPKTQSGPKRLNAKREVSKPAKKKSADVTLSPNSADTVIGKKRIFGGSFSNNFNEVVIDQVLQSMWIARSDKDKTDKQIEEKTKKHIEAALIAMAAIKPKDAHEGMFAAEIVATHYNAMDCLRRANLPGQSFELRCENLNQAIKLMRCFAGMTAALDSHRGKGQQHVTVEHVHVNQGGQAIVGNVTPRGGGGGGGGGGRSRKNEEQPSIKGITHETGIPMPRPHPERKTVPVAGRKGKDAL